jgi:cob(I)alamin adenosyltransferase
MKTYTEYMAFEDFKQKDSVVVVYTGDSKGKTSAGLGLMTRGLGNGWRVAFIQFIKLWDVSEHQFIQTIMPLYEDQLDFYKGGLGFYEAGDLSADATSAAEHKQQARSTYDFALRTVTDGGYELVICDEINNAVADSLLNLSDLERLIDKKHPRTSLCLTGRNFPMSLLPKVDIATDMVKLKHHFDDKFLANKGIDY